MGFSLTRAQKLALVIIALFTVALYGQLLSVGKLNWDDDSNIFKNPYYQLGQWKQFWTDSYFGLYVPVTSMVWQALYIVGKGTAFPFRLFNLLLHLANVYLVFQILKSLAVRWNLNSMWALIAGVALFALHPMQVQAVAWISGGRDLLSAFFSLLCILIFFRWKHWLALPLTSLLFACAVLSKPNSVVLPAVLPLLCYLADRERLGRSFLAAALWMVGSALSIWGTLHAQRDFLIPLDFFERLLIMGDTFSFYLQKFVMPYPWSANYNRRPEIILQTWEPLLRTLLLVAALITLYTWAKWREKRFLILAVWFALLLPVSGLVSFGYQKISTTADHYHYVPMVAMAAVCMVWANMCPYWPRLGAHLTKLLIPVLFVVSVIRVQAWTSDEKFFREMIKYAPESYSTGLGMSLVECSHNRNFAEGERWCHLALKERPLDMMVLANLAFCRFNSRDFKRTVELESYLDQIDIAEMEAKQPSAYSSFLASVGSGMMEDGHFYDGYQLICHAYRIKPSDPNNFQNIRVGSDILRKAGIEPVCEGVLKYGKNRVKPPPDESPADP